MVKNLPANLGLIPESGRSLGEGNAYPPQYSCLENSMDREAWQATVHGVTKSWMRLSTQARIHYKMISTAVVALKLEMNQ